MMSLFEELIQVALCNRESLSRTPTEEEWECLYDMCQKQAVTGVVFDTFERLSKHDQRPPRALLLKWMSRSEKIKKKNILMNKGAVALTKLFADAGFDSCILKGQGNAGMYPNPLARIAGDIDIWVNGDKEEIVKYVRKYCPHAVAAPHHIDFPVFKGISVEVHYIPEYSIIARFQRPLEAFIEEQRDAQFHHPAGLPNTEGQINVPTDIFNLIHQLLHMQRHFFYEGVGLRQVIDYYYLLIHVYGHIDVTIVKDTLRKLGLLRFATAIMWVLHSYMGLDGKYLVVESDARRGKLLLKEILKTGNFGKFEKRGFTKIIPYSKTLSVYIRNVRMMGLFPEEAFFSPITGVIKRFFDSKV